MCRLNLKDAYLLVPINSEDKKFLRFEYRNHIYQFNSLPFGLSSAPFVFTKTTKPIVKWLRSRGIRLVIYLDDFLIFSVSREECVNNPKLTISMLLHLGFIINWEKSDLVPNFSCKFLGIIINSREMTLELPPEKN